MSTVEHERALQHLQTSRDRLRVRMQERRSPLPAGLALVAQAGRSLLRPVAQQHPFALVAGAFATGSAVAALRPWRVLASSALVVGLLSRIGSQLVAQIPLGSWIGTVQDAVLSRIDAAGSPMPPRRDDS